MDGLYGQDPYAYFGQAVAIFQRLPARQLPPLDFFWPNGYPLLVAGLMPLTGPTPPAGQAISLVCGAMLSPLVYFLCQDLLPGQSRRYLAGSVAGLIIAVAGQPILSSIIIMADMPALFWASLAAWLTVRGAKPRHHSPIYYLGAGLAIGLAVITRWIYLLIIPALTAYTLCAVWQRKLHGWQPLPAAVIATSVILPQIWLSQHHPSGLWHSFLLDWHPAHFWQRSFENIDGHFSYRLPNALFYAQPAGHPAYIFPLLGLAAGLGVWQMWRSRQWSTLMLLLGWIAPVYLFLAGIPFQNFRFGLTLYPPLTILAGYGLVYLWYAGKPARRSVIVSVVTVSLAAMLLWAYPLLNSFLSAQQHRKAIARQVAQTLPAHSSLLAFDITLTVRHYTSLNVIELFYQTPTTLTELLKPDPPLFLLANPTNLKAQWQNKAPWKNYQWLVHHATLTQIDDFPPYTLFKIHPPTCNNEASPSGCLPRLNSQP